MIIRQVPLRQDIDLPQLFDEWDEWALAAARVSDDCIAVLAKQRFHNIPERTIYLYHGFGADGLLNREHILPPYDVIDGGDFANALTVTDSHLAVTSPVSGCVHIMSLDDRQWREVPVPAVLKREWHRPSPLVSLFSIDNVVYAVSFYYRHMWSIDPLTGETNMCPRPPKVRMDSGAVFASECVCRGQSHFIYGDTHVTYSPVAGWRTEQLVSPMPQRYRCRPWSLPMGEYQDYPVLFSPATRALDMVDEVSGDTKLTRLREVPWDLRYIAPAACVLDCRTLVCITDPTHVELCEFSGPVFSLLFAQETVQVTSVTPLGDGDSESVE
ncbi:hypothetical protein KIPB_002913 [Kipferlia bialata]|uniref:Uncharacterized protein n=1 Tax=Kipferlia bialata TaxID=797122 RepID=A0A391NV18_9EUKA|nr:hypothetical protein KIPB_002913 [Kipferlia bialata]|eukprot:g2913.t1